MARRKQSSRPPKLADVMAEVVRHLGNRTWRVSFHAEDNMEIDGLTREMLRFVLETGRHIEKHDEFSKTHGAWSYAIHWCDDGRHEHPCSCFVPRDGLGRGKRVRGIR